MREIDVDTVFEFRLAEALMSQRLADQGRK